MGFRRRVGLDTYGRAVEMTVDGREGGVTVLGACGWWIKSAFTYRIYFEFLTDVWCIGYTIAIAVFSC